MIAIALCSMGVRGVSVQRLLQHALIIGRIGGQNVNRARDDHADMEGCI
ncbi:hypothetical protein EMWEY_00059140, partial [Eimeria maxima]